MLAIIRPGAAATAFGLLAATCANLRGDEPPKPARPAADATYALPGEDPPAPFVPLRPRTVDDRRRVEAIQAFAAARALEDDKKFPEAIALLEKALDLAPDSAPILRRLGLVCDAAGQGDKAMTYRRRVIAGDPGDSATIQELFRHYAIRRRDPAAAEAFLKEVRENPKLDRKSPGSVLIANDLGKLYAGPLHRPDLAADAFAEVVDALDEKSATKFSAVDLGRIFNGDEAGSYLDFGKAFLEAKKPDLSIRAFQRGLVYDPDHPLLSLLLSGTLAEQGRKADALEVLDRYLRRQPAGRDGYDLLAELLRSMGRADEIVPRLERAAELDPKNLPLQFALAEQYRAAGMVAQFEKLSGELMKQQPDLAGAASVVPGLIREGKAEKLLEVLDSVLGRLPGFQPLQPQIELIAADPAFADRVLATGLAMISDDPPRLSRNGLIILLKVADAAKKPAAKVGPLKAFLARTPNPPAYRELIASLDQTERFAEAEATLNELADRFPDERNARLLNDLALIRIHAGQYDKAIEAAKESLRLEPNDLMSANTALSRLSDAQARAGRVDEAMRTLRDATRANPENLELLFNFGNRLAQYGREPEAIDLFRSLIDRFKDNDELVKLAHSSLSIIYTGLGDFAKGEAELEILYQKDPDDPGVNNDLGYLYADQGKNLEKAEAMIRKAIDKADEQSLSAYLDSLGWVLFKRGKFREAIEPLKKAAAMERGETDPVMHEHLGDSYFELKDYAKARASYEQAERIAAKAVPPDKRLGELRKKLGALTKLGPPPKTSDGGNP